MDYKKKYIICTVSGIYGSYLVAFYTFYASSYIACNRLTPVFLLYLLKTCYNPVFDSYTYKNPSKILINSAFFEGLFA